MIVSTDIQWLLSAPQAAAGYAMPGNAGNSLGLYVSTSQLSQTNNGLDNIFNDLSGAQNAGLQVDYACVFVFNNNKTGNTMIAPVVWLPIQLLGGTNTATFAVGADPTLPSLLTATSPQATAISSSIIQPSNVSIWASPSSVPSGGVGLPNIPPGQVAAVWIQRTAGGLAGQNQYGIEVTFDSLA